MATIHGRIVAAQKYVLNKSASIFLGNVKLNGPKDEFGKEYLDSLKIKKIDGDDPKFVIILDASFSASFSTAQAKGAVVIYVQDSENKDLLEVLYRYQPFAMDFLPVNLPISTFFKKVRTDEIEAIRERNQNSYSKLKSELISLGVPSELGEQKITSTEDVGFKILRSELGLGEYPPHWKPAIAKWQTGTDLKNIANENILSRILFDPKYTGWKNIASDREDADPSIIENVKEFMEALL